MADIKAVNLCHVYSRGTPFEKVALDNINFEIPQGQIVGIIGHTGSGKSSLIQHLNALLQPTEGTVYLGGENINASKELRRKVRFRVGIVFQYPEYQLFEEKVYDDIAFGPRNMKLSADEIDARVHEAAGFAGVNEELLKKSPLELSGGQKRRIAIAGVIAMRPEVLILDEPTAGLDPEGCSAILENICNYHSGTSATVIIVSHNMDDVARIAQRIIVLNKGAVALDGTPDEVFSNPMELRSMGLDIPKPTELAMELKALGMNIKGPVYTHDQLLEAVKKAREY